MLTTLRLIAAGWRIIFRELARLVALLLACLRIRLRKHDRDGPQRKYRDVCCAHFPWHIHARPEPYIYSQEWLMSRGIAVVWQNPDFELIDTVTNLPVPPFNLQPGHRYVIEATIHNNSFMAAIGTQVEFEVLRFGAGTAVTDNLGTDLVDVPGAGAAIARAEWTTPASGGHHCLRARIVHPDDMNPLNNLGQHNTDVARPASPQRRLRFLVGNHGTAPKRFRLELDAYRLFPVRCAESYRERQSLGYLRKLQKDHARANFPVPEFLHATLSHEEVEVAPGLEIEVTLEMDPPSAGQGTHSVNVNVFEGTRLAGGVTAYVEEA